MLRAARGDVPYTGAHEPALGDLANHFRVQRG